MKTRGMHPTLRAKFDSLQVAADRGAGMSAMPGWLERNTAHPLDPKKPWSFKYHEYQVQILKDITARVAVRKSSQVGLSEISSRMGLALCALYDGQTFIYTLPTAAFAERFCQTRIDSVIRNSPVLLNLLDRDINSSKLKRIGNSHLFVAGAQKEGISIPARGLILDEIDFSNPATLTTYESRITHNAPGTEIVRKLSTPTMPKYGIDIDYEAGTQYQYLCRHDPCGQWVEIDPVTCLKVPGFDGDSMLGWDSSFLEDQRVRPKDAYIECPSCRVAVTQENLIDPEKRKWVAKYPDREISSYQVRPSDVAFYNPPAKILAASRTYARVADFINFTLGSPYTDAESQVIKSLVEASARGRAISPLEAEAGIEKAARAGRVVIGMDVGKTCHIVIGMVEGSSVRILWLERIPQGLAAETFLKRMKQYQAVKGVVDALPDATLSRACVEGAAWSQVFASYFVRSAAKKLKDFDVDKALGVVNVPRTNFIDAVVKSLNKGKTTMPGAGRSELTPEIEMAVRHACKLHRISRTSAATGDRIESWVSSDSEDHYMFALIYCMVGSKMIMADAGSQIVLPTGVWLVRKAALQGAGPKEEKEEVTASGALLGTARNMYGRRY